jgi:hypothetical protein
MFDPLRAPYAFELQALHRQEALLREAVHGRLLRALARARRPGGSGAGEGRPGWRSWLVRLVGAQLIRWGYRLLPLSPPARLPAGLPAGVLRGLPRGPGSGPSRPRRPASGAVRAGGRAGARRGASPGASPWPVSSAGGVTPAPPGRTRRDPPRPR